MNEVFSCSNQDHSVTESVSPLGFLLLEQVHLAVGLSPQMKVDKVDFQELADGPGWPLLSVLSKRVSCQQKQPDVIQVDTVTCHPGGQSVFKDSPVLQEHLL